MADFIVQLAASKCLDRATEYVDACRGVTFAEPADGAVLALVEALRGMIELYFVESHFENIHTTTARAALARVRGRREGRAMSNLQHKCDTALDAEADLCAKLAATEAALEAMQLKTARLIGYLRSIANASVSSANSLAAVLILIARDALADNAGRD